MIKRVSSTGGFIARAFITGSILFTLLFCVIVLVSDALALLSVDDSILGYAVLSSLSIVVAWLAARTVLLVARRVGMRARPQQLRDIAKAQGLEYHAGAWADSRSDSSEEEDSSTEAAAVTRWGSGISSLHQEMLRNLGYNPARVTTIATILSAQWMYSEYKTTVYSFLNPIIEFMQRETLLDESRLTSHYRYSSAVKFILSRKLPHLYFDSRFAFGGHAGHFVGASQTLPFQGSFNDTFIVYAPAHYPIDTLALITPEVMQALLDAKSYDIEIVDNFLYVYGDGIPNDPAEYRKLVDAATLIHEKLMHNLVSYRDERVSYEKGRQTVSTYGKRLSRRTTWDWLRLAGGAFVTLCVTAFFAMGLMADTFWTNVVVALAVVIPLWAGCVLEFTTLYKERRRRHQKEAQYRRKFGSGNSIDTRRR